MQQRRQSQFNARKKFHYAILCVRAMVRIRRLRFTLEPLKVEDAMYDPYRVKILRKVSFYFRRHIIYCAYSQYYFNFRRRLSMAVRFVSMDIGLKRAKDKIVPLSSKIHREPNCMPFIWQISVDSIISLYSNNLITLYYIKWFTYLWTKRHARSKNDIK